MITNLELDHFFQDIFLQQKNIKDIVPNGLQFEGKLNIAKVSFAVSATHDVITKAIENGSDALFTHHGFFWPNDQRSFRGAIKSKFQKLFDSQLNIFAYHLPLDLHPKFGNNYPILSNLKCKNINSFCEYGFMGELEQELTIDELEVFLSKTYSRKATLVVPPHKKHIKNIAILSGQGTSYLPQIVAINSNSHNLKIDTFITGEASEWSYSMSKENNIVYVALGHNNSEEIGVKLIQKLLLTTFRDLECHFIAEDNPF